MVDIIHTYDTDTLGPVEWVLPGLYRLRHKLPPMFLKAGSYSVSLNIGTPTTLIHELNSVVQFDVEENSINPIDKGYRKDRPGHIVSPGTWERHYYESDDLAFQ